jgi:hypothetical protein
MMNNFGVHASHRGLDQRINTNLASSIHFARVAVLIVLI